MKKVKPIKKNDLLIFGGRGGKESDTWTIKVEDFGLVIIHDGKDVSLEAVVIDCRKRAIHVGDNASYASVGCAYAEAEIVSVFGQTTNGVDVEGPAGFVQLKAAKP